MSDPIATNNAPEAKKRRFFHRPSKRALLLTLSVVAGLTLLGFAGASFASFEYGQKYDGKILSGAIIAGVEVGGMEEAAAIEVVKEAIGPQLDRTISLTYGT